MFIKIIQSVAALYLLTACGVDSTRASTQRGASHEAFLADNGPDFKTEDGIEILTWVKSKAVQKDLCATVREQKALGFGVSDPQTSMAVARKFRLHTAEAEVVILYAVEFGCPELS